MNLIPELDNIESTKKNCSVLKEWSRLKIMLREHPNNVVVPNLFLQVVHMTARLKNREIFTGFAQNDMPEFLLFLIETLHDSICRPVHMNINGRAENTTDHLAIQCYTMMKEVYSKEYSEIMDLFYGISVSQIIGVSKSPKGQSLKPEPFFILDLPIAGESIYHCLDEYVADELLEGDNAWFNEKTNKKQSARKNIVFWNFPKILVIVFKRFSANGQSKNGAFIQFPIENLNLSKYAVGYNPNSYVYDLFGVCNHMGGISGGHYTSFGKVGDSWFHYNDTRVEEVPRPEMMVTPAAYCLFYRKKNKR
jgi:ubiquitin carboxyl-terminal hydrolase 8